MATTHRDSGASLILTLGLLAACLPAHAQKQTPTQTQTPKPAQTQAPALQEAAQPEPAPEQTTQFQPMVDVMLTVTNNANGTSTTAPPRKDTILSTSAGANFKVKGANSHAEGQWRFTSVKYARDSQPSRILPSGLVDLHTDLYRKEAGFDASLSADQVSSTVGTSADANNTANTTTNTRLSLSPFYVRQFDDEASLLARLRRTWIHSASNGSSNVDDRGMEDNHQVRWERRPVRLGYALEATYSKSPIFAPTGSGLPDSALTRKAATASLLYAITPEFALGPILGRESSQLEGQSLSGTIRGGQIRWKPNERTQLNATLKHSVFGREWELDASRKTPWTTFGITSRRSAEATAPASATALQLGAVTRETTAGRTMFTGRRDSLSVSAGLTRTTPIERLTPVNVTGSSIQRTKEYFFDTEVIHKLTPQSNLTGGLRWSRGLTMTTDTLTLSRDFTARIGLSTKLMSDTTATAGIKRQLTHNPSTSTSSESAVFVGLGHRF